MKRLSLSQKLLFSIITIHLLLFFCPQITLHSQIPKDKKPIVIRTTLIPPSPNSHQNTTLTPSLGPPKKSSLVPKEKVSTKEAKPPPKESKTHPKKKEKTSLIPEKIPNKPKKQPLQNKQQLISQIHKKLGKIDTSPSVNLSTIKDPPKPLQLNSVQRIEEEEIDLTSCFTFFQESLELPDKGEVKVRMNLLPNGKIEQVQILASESMANAKYVAEILPSLTLKSNWDKTISLTVTFRGNS